MDTIHTIILGLILGMIIAIGNHVSENFAKIESDINKIYKILQELNR